MYYDYSYEDFLGDCQETACPAKPMTRAAEWLAGQDLDFNFCPLSGDAIDEVLEEGASRLSPLAEGYARGSWRRLEALPGGSGRTLGFLVFFPAKKAKEVLACLGIRSPRLVEARQLMEYGPGDPGFFEAVAESGLERYRTARSVRNTVKPLGKEPDAMEINVLIKKRDLALTGRDLQEFGYKGKAIAEALESLQRMVCLGEIENTRGALTRALEEKEEK